MASSLLREKLDRNEFFFAPGIQDMITAVIAKKVGLDVVYASGYWLTASAYGLPDAGIATFTQMLDRVATLVRSSSAAVIADADTGEDDADHGGPGVEARSQVLRHQAGGHELEDHDAGATGENQRVRRQQHTPRRAIGTVVAVAHRPKPKIILAGLTLGRQ